MSRAERRTEESSNLFAFQMKMGAELLMAPFTMNPFLTSTENSEREKPGDSWRITTTRDLRKLNEQGIIQEPDDYGFDSYSEMKAFVRGRHEESGNSFRWNRSDRKDMNEHSPRGASAEESMRSFTSSFYQQEDPEDVQRLLESVAVTEEWELEQEMHEVIREYGELVTEGEAELGLSDGNEELLIRFSSGEELYPEVELLYRTGEDSYQMDIGQPGYEELPEILDAVPDQFA